MAEQLGPYLLESRIGSGGMADVFLARGPSGVCVVKRPHPHLCANPEFVRMFLDEASVLAQLYHPGIAHIFDLGQSAGVYYLAMEYVPGFDLMTISLEHERQGEFMAADLAAKVIADAAGALDYAHRAMGKNGQPLGLIHRDVTPHNILVSTSGEVKVIDFGVARAAKSMHHTAAGLVKGKYPYMAPEQITGQAIDSRVDIYALGLVLYELLTNARAIAGELEFEQIDNARAARIKPVEQLRPNVPGPLKQILAQALHPQAAGRYQTAAQMQTELLNYLQTERHVVGREDLVRLFRVVAAEAAHQLPTFPPGHGDLSIRETMPARDSERIEDTLPPPGGGLVPPLPSPMPSPQRSDTYPSNPRAKADAHTSRTDKSAAHQIPLPHPPDASTRPTDANVRVELKFGGAAAPPVQLETPAEHPTYPGLPPPTKLIPSKAAQSMGLSPLDSSFRRTIINPKKPPYLIVAFTLALLAGAGAVAWLYLREPLPAPLPPKPVIEPPVKPVNVEAFDAAVAVTLAPDASVAEATPDASTPVAEASADAGIDYGFNVLPAAAVLVDGKNYGTSGGSVITLRLPPGPHTVVLQFGDGHLQQEHITAVEGGKNLLYRRFQKPQFTAWFDDFAPQSATIDGKPAGTPGFAVVRANLWEGSHMLIAVGEVGGVKKTIRQPFLIKAGAINEMRFKFAEHGH